MEPEKKTKKDSLWEIVRFALITMAIVIPIRLYIAQPFIVNGASMDPTFKDGQYLIVDELSFLLRDPERGEVVVFRYPEDPSKFFIKRIIGLPGETVKIVGDSVIIIKDGQDIVLEEPYVANHLPTLNNRTLGDNEYFVMGDNRPASSDSRIWGPVDRDKIKGRAFVRLLPPQEAAILPGNHNFQY